MISIITPYFNSSRFLPETIASVLAQTYAEWEWLVVDDGSSDGSAAVAARRSRTVLVNERTRGQSYSRNLAATQATGDLSISRSQ